MIEEYKAAVEAAIEEALSQGVFFDTDMKKFVRERCDALDPAADNFLGELALPADFQARRELRSWVVSHPRGTWAVTRSGDYWKPIISDGMGNASAGGGFDSYDSMPSYETVYGRMVGYEIYLARNAVEERMQQDKNIAALKLKGISLGQKFRDIRIGSTEYSTGIVTGIEREIGSIKLLLTKRGSRNRWNATIGASRLS